ncbi:MAG: protein translocase subunit SecDF [Prevotellaceae bacterium]|jgi:SecD/SecF fusion protein|nr:protein translocase subunit SecDF [Prevotellaceae bacterium]
MQNKGFIRIFSIALGLVCLFYLSFSVVTVRYSKKAKEFAKGDNELYYKYMDSVAGQKVWLGYTLKECREKEISLGLDLKGGMNVILGISVPDVLVSLSEYNQTDIFTKAMDNAKKRKTGDFLNNFQEEFEKIDQNARLSTIFSTIGLKEKIQLSSTNKQVIEVLRAEIKSAIDNSFNVLRSRIDRFGVVQPNIQQIGGNDGRILVELPGIKEPERVRKLLQGSANLEFWETYDASELSNILEQINSALRDINVVATADSTTTADVAKTPEVAQNQEVVKTDSLKDVLKQSMDSATNVQADEKAQQQAVKNNPLFAILGRSSMGPQLGAVATKDTAKIMEYFNMPQVKRLLPRNLKLQWTVKPVSPANDVDHNDRYGLIALKISNREGIAPLSGDVITDARQDFDQITNESKVSMRMNSEGASTWARLTKANINKSIAISLDNYVYSSPTVRGEIAGGNSEISGHFTPEEAKDLANVLKSGKMPAPARIIQEDVVGPSLGQEAISKGMISFVLAFFLVLLYMIFYYGLVPGIIADIALLGNIFFMMGILASFQATLTLPGIAGIVLTLGMAVDANVLIYERIREEIEGGKNLKKAIEAGFSNALSAIIDGQLTTLLTGIILFILGTGPVKGFATTLIIGITTSLFSSIFFSRLMFEYLISKDKDWKIPFTTGLTKNWFRNFNIDFIKIRKIGYGLSITLVTVCILSLAFRGLKPGIDFSGGRTYVVRFEQPIDAENVRNTLEDVFPNSQLSVITMGDANQVRISTNYSENDGSENANDKVELMLYSGLKPFLNTKITQDMFVHRYTVNNGAYQLSDTDDKSALGIQSSSSVGPTIAGDMKTKAIWAVIISLIGIFLYVLLRFRNYAFSVGGVVALAHDALFTIGCYSLFYSIMPFSLEIDQSFVAAILTIIGYSINDTVVIFDRVRENQALYPKRDIADIMNLSLNQTLSRTFSTTFTVVLTLLAMFILGGEVIRGFIFAMLAGVVAGMLSTVFVASPLAYDILKKESKSTKKKK